MSLRIGFLIQPSFRKLNFDHDGVRDGLFLSDHRILWVSTLVPARFEGQDWPCPRRPR